MSFPFENLLQGKLQGRGFFFWFGQKSDMREAKIEPLPFPLGHPPRNAFNEPYVMGAGDQSRRTCLA